MKRVFRKFRELVRHAEAKAAVTGTLVLPTLVMAASAADETASGSATIVSAFTSGFQTMANEAIGMIAAMAPVALSLAGVIFLVKKAMGWFKSIAK